jgi:hypothetical protein
VPFYCHHGVQDGEPHYLCRGWAAAMALKSAEESPSAPPGEPTHTGGEP